MISKNDFALTPPMGWNSFDYYDTCVREEDVKKNADYMAEHLKKYGYEYIVVDIAWYAHHSGEDRAHYEYIPFDTLEMDAYSRLQPDVKRFPSAKDGAGFRPLADYVHAKGLKFGIHIMRGIPRAAAQNHMPLYGTEVTADQIANPSSVCLWNPDMYGVRDNADGQHYYDTLLELYASWGVDYIKCDDICDSRMKKEGELSTWAEIEMLHCAIEKCGRPIVLSLSPGPAHIDKAWFYAKNANMWRITDDFWDDYALLKNMFYRCELWQDHVRKGCFPDCDMLPLGRIGEVHGDGRHTRFTADEAKTMMTLWCFFRAPLMIGAELTLMDEETVGFLTNGKLLACLSESAEGKQIYREDDRVCWKNTDPETGAVRIALFNTGEEEKELSVSTYELEETVADGEKLTGIWDEENASFENGVLSVSVPAHGVKAYVLDRSEESQDPAEAAETEQKREAKKGFFAFLKKKH